MGNLPPHAVFGEIIKTKQDRIEGGKWISILDKTVHIVFVDENFFERNIINLLQPGVKVTVTYNRSNMHVITIDSIETKKIR
jgi:hypothetical protein